MPDKTDKDRRIAELEAQVDALKDVILDLAKGLAKPAVSVGADLDPRVYGVMCGLTPKQHCVLQMLVRGARNSEIAERLEVTEATAKTHVRSVAKRFGVETRSQVAVLAAPTLKAIDGEEYKRMSGLPKDWDEKYDPDDPWRSVYMGGGEDGS